MKITSLETGCGHNAMHLMSHTSHSEGYPAIVEQWFHLAKFIVRRYIGHGCVELLAYVYVYTYPVTVDKPKNSSNKLGCKCQ